METIKMICEEERFTIFDGNFRDQTYEGYVICTNKRNIKIGIVMSEDGLCKPGYFMSEDNLQFFDGAEYLGIEVTDKQLKKKKVFSQNNLQEGDVMFVNINTSKGVLQFVAYNEHNGYYGVDCAVAYEEILFQENI
jgi:hypothetical protein